MGSSDEEYSIMAQSTAGKHLLVQTADFPNLFTELWLRPKSDFQIQIVCVNL